MKLRPPPPPLDSPLLPVGVVTNVHSGRNRRGRFNADRLRALLGKNGLVRETRHPDELDRVIELFRKRNVRVIAVNGGDGTWGMLLERLLDGWPAESRPALLPLRGGTMNMVAGSLGLRGSPTSILERFLAAAAGRAEKAGRFAQKLLGIESSERARPHYGFVWANGMAYSFLREYYSRAPASFWNALWTTTSLIAGGPLPLRRCRLAWQTVPARVEVDGRRVLDGRLRIAVASVLSKLVLWFSPFGRGVGGPRQGFGFMLNAMPMHQVMARLWGLSRGQVQERRHFSCVAERVVVDSAGGYLVDGEPFQPAGRVQLTIRRGPFVQLVSLRARKSMDVTKIPSS